MTAPMIRVPWAPIEAYMEWRTGRPFTMRQLALESGVRPTTLRRFRAAGYLTLATADALAVAGLHVHPAAIWAGAWWAGTEMAEVAA